MKMKQIAGIIVAGLVIILVGVAGVASNIISGQMTSEKGFLDSVLDEMEAEPLPTEDFVGMIDIVGEIGPETEDVFGLPTSGYNHWLYMDYIDELMYMDNNKGIFLYIDSPGGTVYESDELYLKLMEYKEVTGRPIWAYFASEACSGGYYIGMAADKIYANRNCWTGSIGVIVSLMNCKDLYEKIGIEEIDITSGANKAMGSAGLDLTEEQYEILQGLVDEAYDQFVEIVSVGRKMDEKKVRELADGRIYSAKQALEHGLIDEIALYEDALYDFEEAQGWEEGIYYHTPEAPKVTMFDTFLMSLQKLKPRSDMELATDILENNGNGVLKYYAK